MDLRVALTFLDRLLPNLRARRGHAFDRRHGVETTEILERDKLIGLGPELRRHAGEYIPTDDALFHRIMRKSRIDKSGFTFVDLGCGKGRTLIAAASYPFRAILGVEADRALYETALDNIASWTGEHEARPIHVVHADAQLAELPAGDLFIFMYSPFRGPVFERVAERLAAIAGEPGRAIVIAYSSDFESAVLERTGRFVRVRMRRRQFWAPSTVSFFYNEAALRRRR